MNNNIRICPACGSSEWEPLLATHTSRVITGDQRIGQGSLNKIICKACGVGANRNPLSDQEIDLLYGSEYVLNTLGREEHQFFTSSGSVSRSKVFFEWIFPHIPRETKNFLEIGCGEGNLLAHFVKALHDCEVKGIDGSFKACELAQSKGLDVKRGLIIDEIRLSPFDVILACNVIEHVEKIDSFLRVVHQSLRPGGRAIFTLPVQDYPGYDLYFAEHVWHFTVSQFKSVLARHGFNIVFEDSNHVINSGIGLFICSKGTPLEKVQTIYSTSITNNRDFWNSRFLCVNDWLKNMPTSSRIAIFGASEVATLLMAFTELGDRDPIAFIDEDPLRIGSLKHGVEIFHPDWLRKGLSDNLLLAVNPKYHDGIIKKFAIYPVQCFSFVGQG